MKKRCLCILLLCICVLTVNSQNTRNLEGVDYVSLDAIDYANCYIIEESGKYCFELRDAAGGLRWVDGCEPIVIWSDYSSSFISNMQIVDKVLYFDADMSTHQGNAGVAIKDQNNKILWSWHLWLTDQTNYKTASAGELLNIPLGSISNSRNYQYGDTYYALLYQYNRKDPFPIQDQNVNTYALTENGLNAYDNIGGFGTFYEVDYNEGMFEGSMPTTACSNKSFGSKYIDANLYRIWEKVQSPCPPGFSIPSKKVLWKAVTNRDENYVDYDEYLGGLKFDDITDVAKYYYGLLNSRTDYWFPAFRLRTPYIDDVGNIHEYCAWPSGRATLWCNREKYVLESAAQAVDIRLKDVFGNDHNDVFISGYIPQNYLGVVCVKDGEPEEEPVKTYYEGTELTAGRTYTSSDFSDIKSGSFSISSDGKELHMNNLFIDYNPTGITDHEVLSNSHLFTAEGNVTVHLTGKNTLQSKGGAAWMIGKNSQTTFTGGGSLYVYSQYSYDILLWEQISKLVIDDCSIVSERFAIGNELYYYPNLFDIEIHNGMLQGNNLMNITSLKLEGCEIINPEGGTFVAGELSGSEIKDKDGNPASSFLISSPDKIPVTVTAKDYTIKYGEELPVFEFTSEGATLNGTPSITCEATKTSPVGTYPIIISKGSITNSNVNYVYGTLTIEKAPLTITAKDYSIKQGEALPTFEATYVGFKNNETKSVLTKKPTITTTATSASNPGKYDITVSGAEAKNYEISYVKGKLTITEADPITITAKSYTIKYGDDIPAFEFTSEGATLNGTPSITCEATKTSPVGIYPIVISKGNVKNFNDTYLNGTLTIEKAPLKITAKDYTIKQGEALPTFEATYEGFKNNETKSVLTKKPTITTTATSASNPGKYDITVSGAEAKNYDISYVKGKLTITEADPITITAKSYTIKYGDDIPTFEFVSDGATINGTPSITCEATKQSPVGTYPIVISKGSVTNYNVAYVNGTLTIEKAPLKITAKDYTIKQGDPLPTFEATYEGFKNDETEAVLTKKPTITTTATSASEPDDYDIVVSGAEAQNYDISYDNGKLTITEADGILGISVEHPADVYDLQGNKVRSKITTLKDLPKGVYIINKKKVLVK